MLRNCDTGSRSKNLGEPTFTIEVIADIKLIALKQSEHSFVPNDLV